MRIITGTAKGTRLETLDGLETRPTTEMVKEAMFSIIQFDLEGRRVLDLFGGSGQLALEALSRGAENAVIVDAARDAISVIKANASKTKLYEKCRISSMDWRAYIKGAANREKFSLVFLDPPYKEEILNEIIKKLIHGNMLTDDAIIICESDADGVPEPVENYIAKSYRYGAVYVTVLRNANTEETEETQETEEQKDE